MQPTVPPGHRSAAFRLQNRGPQEGAENAGGAASWRSSAA